jgi:adenylyltransferase/sulfurtransferase
MSRDILQDEITVTELKKRQDAGEKLLLLDIREPYELDIAVLANSIHIPMGDIPDRLEDLKQYEDSDIVVYCRSGRRSAHCVEFLREQGFARSFNLKGGIIAWSDEVDSSVQKY